MHIVVDGYNMILRARLGGGSGSAELESGREALVDALAAYKKIKPHKITVVFDAGAAPPGLPRRERLKGIHLHYSRPGELADTVIKRMAGRERERLLVVSSDQEVARDADAKGAATITVEAFEQKLLLARMGGQDSEAQEEQDGWRPTTRKKGPARRLPKKRRKLDRKLNKF